MLRRPTVVELTEVRVEPPLVEGAPALFMRLGIFSCFETASTWIGRRVARDDESDGDLLYYSAEEIVVDDGLRVCNAATYSRDGTLRGKVSGGVERPWGGREPAACRSKPGNIVGLVGVAYRIGVVLAPPPSPDEARCWSDVTLGDALYLVGVLGTDGSPATNDHEHVTEPSLFPVEHEVSPEVRAALAQRFAAYRR